MTARSRRAAGVGLLSHHRYEAATAPGQWKPGTAPLLPRVIREGALRMMWEKGSFDRLEVLRHHLDHRMVRGQDVAFVDNRHALAHITTAKHDPGSP